MSEVALSLAIALLRVGDREGFDRGMRLFLMETLRHG